MALEYLNQGNTWGKTEAIKANMLSAQTEIASVKRRRRHLFCLLLLVDIIVLNVTVLYSFWAAEKDTSVWEAITTKNVISRLWTEEKCPSIYKSYTDKYGVVVGIICSTENPTALINNEIVHEGDTINGVRVIEISRDKIQFEKNSSVWTQKVLEKPNPAW